MEFVAKLNGESYHFLFLNNNSVLVSSNTGEYILYKTKEWRCADELKPKIVQALGEIIDEQLLVLND